MDTGQPHLEGGQEDIYCEPAFNRAVQHNIDVVSPSKRDVSTYGGLLDDLNTKEGKARYPDYQSKVESIQQQMASAGAKVVKMPGLFLRTNAAVGGLDDVQ